MKRSALGVISLFVVATLLPVGRAALIPDVSVSSSMLAAAGTEVHNIINGSGLPGDIRALSGTHARATKDNVWASGYKYGSVIFYLPGLYRVNGMTLWPYNGYSIISARDVKWYYSTNGKDYIQIPGAPVLLPQGPAGAAVEPVYYTWPPVQATHLRVDIYSNWGHPSNSGFAEIQFDGAAVGVPDTNPPQPNPMTWAVAPAATGISEITMTASTATDENGVQYYFANLTDSAHDSGWVNEPEWTDTGLARNTLYEYKVKARDCSDQYNETGWSDARSAATLSFECLEYPVADMNSDGRVDMFELVQLGSEWGLMGQLSADLNGDGVVDMGDLLELAAGWLACGRFPFEACLE